MMTSEAQITVRNAGWILVQRLLHAGSGLVFALLVPRLMGPDVYGRYSLLSSLSVWMLLFSNLNLTDVVGRYMPEFILRDDRKGLHQLWSDLFTVRLATAVLAAAVFLGLTALWLRDLDVATLATVAALIVVQAVAGLVFAAFLGFNQAARWQMGETVRQWLSVGLVIVGFRLAELQGAVAGLLLTEFTVLALGVRWIRSHLPWPALHLNAQRSLPYLRFGLIFFASGLFHTALGGSAEVLVRSITGDYAQVGYVGLAWRVFMTMAMVVPQLSAAFIPLLSTLHAQGRTEAIEVWLERVLRYTLVGGVLASLGVLFLAKDLVPLVLGVEFSHAAKNLMWLILTLMPMAYGSVARMVAVTYLRPRLALYASAIHLGAFWVLAGPLIALLGGVGSSISMFAAWALYAALFTWRARRILCYQLRRSALVVGLGALFLPLLLLRSTWQVNVCLFGVSALAYVALLFFTRVVTADEVGQLRRAITRRNKVQAVSAETD